MKERAVYLTSFQTLAIMKGHQHKISFPLMPQCRLAAPAKPKNETKDFWVLSLASGDDEIRTCPWGKIGDVVSVREPWWFDPKREVIVYDSEITSEDKAKEAGWLKKSPRAMSADRSRLSLMIKDIWLRSVTDIDERDARAHGFVCDLHPKDHPNCGCYVSRTRMSQRWDDDFYTTTPDTQWHYSPTIWTVSFEIEKVRLLSTMEIGP